jgi:hypothetical protein
MKKRGQKARNRFLGFCFFSILMLLSARSPVQEPADGEILVRPEDNIYSDSARYYLDNYRRVLTDLLDFPLDTTVVVYIADSDEEFYDLVGSSFPDWGAGAASLEYSTIAIKSPKYIRVGKSFRELLGHELTHIMLHRASGGQWIPRWIHEGLAMRVSGEWSIGQDILVAKAAWTGRLISLYRLENLTAFSGPEANLAYTETYLAVGDLVKPSDRFLLADLLELYRNNRDFYKSFKIVVGDDYSNWAANWMDRTSVRYHYFLFLLDPDILWLMVPLFFILLVILKRRQGARIKKRWKMEERLNPPDESYKKYYDGYYDDQDKI